MAEMTLHEFKERGYLQEVNRQFLHPLGLSLALREDPDGSKRFHAIFDHRIDDAGVTFRPNSLDKSKADYVKKEQEKRHQARLDQHGFVVQPLD